MVIGIIHIGGTPLDRSEAFLRKSMHRIGEQIPGKKDWFTVRHDHLSMVKEAMKETELVYANFDAFEFEATPMDTDTPISD
jgi:hypothetical protein